MQLTALLQAAQSADAAVRNQAEQTLNSLQQQQYAELCVGLSAELADSSKPVDARRLAGLILKNTLDAKEDARKVGRSGDQAVARQPGGAAPTHFDHMAGATCFWWGFGSPGPAAGDHQGRGRPPGHCLAAQYPVRWVRPPAPLAAAGCSPRRLRWSSSGWHRMPG